LTLPACGAEGTRTPDLRRAKAALSQLSYGPACREVGQPGIEPGTSVLSGLRSSRLSYWPRNLERAGPSSVPETRSRAHLSPRRVEQRDVPRQRETWGKAQAPAGVCSNEIVVFRSDELRGSSSRVSGESSGSRSTWEGQVHRLLTEAHDASVDAGRRGSLERR
jgi:hypothetical protein